MNRFLASFFLLVLTTGSLFAEPFSVDDECSVTSTGWVHSAELGSFQATLTVTGPCDGSLANTLRKAIADLRAAFK